jgi:hypothetical protein
VGLLPDEFIQYDWMVQIAAFDGGIIAWRDKTEYDTVRPVSAIRFLWRDRRIRAWGGPGRTPGRHSAPHLGSTLAGDRVSFER